MIASGILYGVLASLEDFIKDWLSQFLHSSVILTGDDEERLWNYWREMKREEIPRSCVDLFLIFEGMRIIAEF